MIQKKYPYTQNRELSWLKFNQRVLEEATDSSVPLLERLKFISIFTSNLDEFIMVRAGSLYDLSLINDSEIDHKSGMKPSEQLDAIYSQSVHLYMMRDHIYKNLNQILMQMQMGNIPWKNLTKKQVKHINHYFENEILPLLSPQVIDFHRPFPHLANKELYIFAELIENQEKKYGIVPIPNFIDRLIYIPDSGYGYVTSEQAILHNLNKVFGKNSVTFKTVIRVTRNADINLNEKDIDEDVDYRGFMKKILKKRSRLAPMRLEVERSINEDMLNYLCKQLKLKRSQVFICKTPLEMKHLFGVISNLPEEVSAPLLYKPFEPQSSKYLNPDEPLIPQIFSHDVLLNYPYQDIGIFLKLLKEASEDKNVVAIKITIYRLASHSKILDYLCRAADNGKDVTVLMELRARFDEQNNILAAERLENAGCTVIYGFEDYKVHSKICMITYKTRRGIQTITQIGTGNYNEKTSRQYTDLSYITAREDIGKDAVAFFQNMAISNLNGAYNHLLVSPMQLKHTVMDKLDELIEKAQKGEKTSALFKLNSLTDLDIIKKLAQASQAGVKIVMIIRGICCILPQMKDYTENIQIFSVVGRFLEHSRIYIFKSDSKTDVYIASADFMTRNTERRVEIGVPIYNDELKQDIFDYVEHILQDNVKRRELTKDGNYVKIDVTEDDAVFNSQEEEIKNAYEHRFILPKQTKFFIKNFIRAFRNKRKGWK